jgi:ferredoxin
MAMKITDACTGCDLCREDCPTQAISEGDPIYLIDADLCDECASRPDKPGESQCLEVCPVEAPVKA